MLSPYKVHTNLRKFLLFSSAIALITTAHAPAIAADSGAVYVLQLGSFDSRAEAQKKWDQLKAKNPDSLGKLNVHISEISMSGDTSVIYRTQAGPVDSHADAAALCSKLQTQGAECYVVETAMFASDTPVDEETADNAAVESPLPWKKKSAGSTKLGAGSQPIQQTTSATATPAAAEEAPEPEEHVHLSPHDVVVPDRAPKFLDAGDSEAPAKVEVASVPKPAETAQAAPVPAPVQAAAPAPAEKKPGFFSSLFSKNGPSKASPSPAEERQQSFNYVQGRQPKYLDESETPAAATQKASAAPTPAPVVETAAPAASNTSAPEAAPAPAPAAPAPAAKKQGFFSKLFSSSKPAAPALPPAPPVPQTVPAPAVAQTAPAKVVGNVNVAEAIRVPLTEGGAAATAPVISSQELAPVSNPTPQVGGTYWAQISYFPDEASAHNFYEGFRTAYPNLADGLRMRITRPYASGGNLGGRVTLRIGSFASAADIATICSLASQMNLDCISVKDTGMNTAFYNSMERPVEGNSAAADPVPTPSAPEENSNFLDAPNHMEYWVQIGTYNSSEDAWDKWKGIQKADKKIVRGLKAEVAEPQASDADNKMYRLRTGPFTHREVAETLCTRLEQHDESCIVVSEARKPKF